MVEGSKGERVIKRCQRSLHGATSGTDPAGDRISSIIDGEGRRSNKLSHLGGRRGGLCDISMRRLLWLPLFAEFSSYTA